MEWTKEAIRALRRRRGETQAQFAAALGVDRTTVSRWETGEVAAGDVAAGSLDALERVPASPSDDYLRGVRAAANEVRAALDAIERQAADAALIALASEAAAESEAEDEFSRPGTTAKAPRTPLRLERGESATPDAAPD